MPLQSLGTYELTETLGKSALGVTYAGQRQGAQVVVKVAEVIADAHESERHIVVSEFRRRGQAVAGLFHPGIVSLRDYNVAANFLYAVSGFVVAGSLIDPEARAEIVLPMTPSQTADFVTQIADALGEAHRLGVAHGNLRPSNIFLGGRAGEKYTVQIGDFPLIWEHIELTVPPFGTQRSWRYVAPENVTSAAPQTAGDQFSLAALAYEWITGQPVFGEGPVERRGPTFVQCGRFRTDLARAEDVDAVIARALLVDPRQRYGSVGEFARALAEVLVPVAAARESAPLPIEEPTPADTNSTRPVTNEIPTIRRESLDDSQVGPSPVQPQANPSAWLLDGSAASIPPTPLPPELQRGGEELYGVEERNASRGGGRRGRGNSRPPVARGPTTREQELMAPPAPRTMPRRARRNAPPPRERDREPAPPRRSSGYDSDPRPSSGEESIFDQLGVPIPRRETLELIGKVALAGAGGVAAVALLANFGGGLVSFVRSLVPEAPRGNKVPAPVTLSGHAGAVRTLTWSPDGTHLASGALSDGTIRLWDPAKSEAPVAQLASDEAAKGVVDLSWARDSRFLMVAVVGAPAVVWNTIRQQIIAHLPYSTTIARWHPRFDIAALVAAADATAEEAGAGKNILIWDITAATLAATLTGHTDVVQALAWDDRTGDLLLASGSKDKSVFAWGGKSAKEMANLAPPLQSFSGGVDALDFSRRSTKLLAGDDAGALLSWTPGQSDSSTIISSADAVLSVAWSPGELAAFGTQAGHVVIYGLDDVRAIKQLEANAAVVSLAWAPDGKHLAAGTDDKRILVWDVSDVG